MIKQNLLPIAWQRRMIINRRLSQWASLWIVTSILAGGACAGKYWVYMRNLRSFEQVQTTVVPLQQIALETQELQRKFSQLEGRESLLATLDSSEHPFQLLGIVSQSAANSSGKVQVNDLSLKTVRYDFQSNLQLPRNIRSQGNRSRTINVQGNNTHNPEPEKVALQLIGTASDDIAVTRFVNQLRKYNVFDSVVLVSSQSTSKGSLREFIVGCEYAK